MKSRSVRLGLLTVGMVLSLALAGCVQIEMESDFESDGSATHSLSTAIDRSFLDDEMMAGELEGELDFDEIEREGEAAGFDVERIDESDRVGVRLSTQVDDNSDLGDVLNDLFNATADEIDQVDAFSGSFTESGGGLGGATYRFELTVDGDALFDDGEDEFDDELDMDFGADMMRQFIDLTYTVSMPGEITDHNGTELGAGRVQWQIPFQGSESFFAESEDEGGLSLALIGGIAVGLLAVILVVIGAFVLMRGRSAPTQPAGAAPTGGYEPPRGEHGTTEPLSETETHAEADHDDEDAPRDEARRGE